MYYAAILLCSFLISFSLIPSIIHIARSRNLYDDLCESRKNHPAGISRLGGVSLFISFIITLLLFNINTSSLSVNALLIACVLIFVLGLKDDLVGVSHYTKFMVQFIAAAIVVFFSPTPFPSFYTSAFSVIVILFVTNAFNLIDGVDGLAATIGILTNTAFSILFIFFGLHEAATTSLAMAGAIFGFIKYNLTPARIFMGDTGSLLIGLVSSTTAIEFVKTFTSQPYFSTGKYSAPVLVIAIFIVPICDTIRVCTIRISKGKSIFQADRNHIHHYLLNIGYTPIQVIVILVSINILVILMAFICFTS